jgi:hypothetical protein
MFEWQVPGKDNYQANLTDSSFGKMAMHYKSEFENENETGVLTVGTRRKYAEQKVLNSGFYSRNYQVHSAYSCACSQSCMCSDCHDGCDGQAEA